MEILVFGAGAVGIFLAGRLAQAGHNVTVVGRDATANAIQGQGLTVTEDDLPFSCKPAAFSSLRQAFLNRAHYDLILACMKAYDVPAAIDQLVAFSTSLPPIISLQNGVGVEELFVAEFGSECVIAGSLTTPVSRETSRSVIVERSDRGLALAPTQSKQNVAGWIELFDSAGITTLALKDYRSMKWSKAMLNMIGNATAAILNRHPRIIYGYGPTFRLEMNMLKETLAVMKRQKIKPVDLPGVATGRLVFAVKRLPEGLVQPILTQIVASGRGDKLPSFHMDLAAGRDQSEVLFHNGAVAKAGQELGVPTPVNTALTDILMKLARKELNYEDFNGQPKRLVAEVRKYQRAG